MTEPPHERLGFAGLSRGAIRLWRIVLIATVGLMLVATMAWSRIPRLEDPRMESPIISVFIPYPGASPEDIEAQVVKPVEEELYGMDGVEHVEAKILPNVGILGVKFEDGTAMETAAEEVRGKVLGRRGVLPAEVGQPTVVRAKTTTFTAQMVLTVAGNRAGGVLTDAARQLKESLTTVPGVANVRLRGERVRAVRVRLDPERLANHRLTVEDVAKRIKLANVRIPGGEVHVGKLVTLLSVDHELSSVEDVARIVIGASGDARGGTRTVTLGDVAEVHEGYKSATERMMQDGVPAVGVELRFQPEANAIDVGKRVRELVGRASLPEGVHVHVAHDQPAWVAHTLGGFTESLALGVVLVMLIITLGMGWRASIVVATVVPISIAGAVFGLYALGFALEQVSIAGLIVALGLLVDDAVVVTESIQIMRDRGLSKVRAAVLGTARVFWANNGTTAVACASFVPLFFMGGDTGAFIRGLPTAVMLALVTSLLLAQLLTPWVATFFLKVPRGVAPIADATPFDREEDSQHDERNPGLRLMRRAYGATIPWIVDNPIKVIGVAVLMLAGSFLLLPRIGVQFFPKADKPVLFVTVEMPRGTDEDVTAQKVAAVVAELRKDARVRSTSAMIGTNYPQIFIGRAPHFAAKDYGDVLVELTSPSNADLVRSLRERVSGIAGARINVEELYHGPPVPHPIMLRIEGDDLAKLQKYANEVKTDLRGIHGAVNISDSLSASIPIADVHIDADRAIRHGVTPAQIGLALRAVYGEDEVTSFRNGPSTIEVVIERAASSPSPLDDVARTPVPTVGSGTVPLLAAAEVKMTRDFAELRRRNTRRMVDVTADVEGGVLPSKVLAELKEALAKTSWDPGYRYAVAGEQEQTEKSFRNLGIAATGTLLLIFVLLVLMFRKLSYAAIVLAAVPFVFIGALTGLYVTGTPFGFMAFLGLVALIGVYVNHKIYFVDRMRELMSRGMPMREAIFRAGLDRVRPVVLTALTAILGLVPLTLTGGAFWAPFGWVNIFGLAASIPLSLVLLPALLMLVRRRAAPTPALSHASVQPST